MYKITPKTHKVCVGLIIELSYDDATHLSYALRTRQRSKTEVWPWLHKFIDALDAARVDGNIEVKGD